MPEPMFYETLLSAIKKPVRDTETKTSAEITQDPFGEILRDSIPASADPFGSILKEYNSPIETGLGKGTQGTVDFLLKLKEPRQLLAPHEATRPATYKENKLSGAVIGALEFLDRPRAAVAGGLISGMSEKDWDGIKEEMTKGWEGRAHPLMGDFIFHNLDKAFREPEKNPKIAGFFNLMSHVGMDEHHVKALLATAGGIVLDIAVDPVTYTGAGLTKKGLAEQARTSLAKEGNSISAPELSKYIRELDKRGELEDYGKTLAEQFARDQRQLRISGVPIPGTISAGVAKVIGGAVDKIKQTKLGDDAWKVFSTKHGLKQGDEGFALLEDRFKVALLLAKETTIKEGAAYRKEVIDISKKMGVPKEQVDAFITQSVERPINVSIPGLPDNQLDLLAKNENATKLVQDLSVKNREQLRLEINAGVRIADFGSTEIAQADKMLTAAEAGILSGALQVKNPVTGKMINPLNLKTRAEEVMKTANEINNLNYFKHALRGDAKKIIDEQQIKRKGSGEGFIYSAQHGSTKQRQMMRDKTIVEINELAKTGDLPGYPGVVFPKGLFHEDPAITQALRDMQHRKVMAVADLVQEAKRQFGVSKDLEFVGDYVRPSNPLARDTFFPKEIADRLDQHFNALMNPNTTGEFLRHWDEGTNWFKAWTLSIFPEYHTRNLAGGVWNNFVTGTKDPNVYKTSQQVMRGMKGTIATVDGRVITFDDIRNNIQMLGVRNRGMYSADIITGIEQEMSAGKWLTLSTNNRLIHYGQKAGEAGDNFTRIAKFVDELQKGKGYHDAAKATQNAHFDYTDLTNWEKNVAKRLLPFYTWSRKNIPLQAQQMLAHPGRYKAVDTARREIEANSEDPGEYNMQQWMLDQYPMRVGLDPVDGKPRYFLFGGWLPAADVYKLASAPLSLPKDLMHPAIQVLSEMITERDWQTGMDLDPNAQDTMFGVEMSKKQADIMRNFRVLATIDKLGFSQYKPTSLTKTTREMTPEEHLVGFLSGLRLQASDPEVQMRSKLAEKLVNSNDIKKWQSRQFIKRQSTSEMDIYTGAYETKLLENLTPIITGGKQKDAAK